MANIEERVVGMRFDSSKFKIEPILSGLDKLKASLKLDGPVKALNDLDNAGRKFSLAGLGTATEGISLKFMALATIGITALSNIVNKAVDAGTRIMKSLTVDPVKAGLDEYELKMGSIQTILANTARFDTGLPEVVASLDELNTYADKTIYNFGDMTKNIGLFTNAGLRIEEATSLIKGFSNESAASGVTAQGAAGAAYQLSQALSAGKVTLMDWRSLTNVGLGNKNMQGGILEIATAMGTFEGKGIDAATAGADFNGSLEKGWLTADVMSNYLKIMAGDMDGAAQSALGLSDAQIEAFAKQQATAEEAATKVRTYTQLVGTMQESVGSGWSQSFDIIIGDFTEATDLFTAVNNTLGGLIGAASDARNKILQDWSDNGGRASAIEGIAAAFNILMSILAPVKEAFQEIFPPVTGAQLAEITKQITAFIQGLKPGEEALANIKSTAKGFFALLDIGRMVLVGFVGMVGDLLGVVLSGTGGFLGFTGGVGDFIVKMRDAIKAGGGINKYFTTVGSILKSILAILGTVIGVVVDFGSSLGDIAKGGFDTFIDKTQARFAALGAFFSGIMPIVNAFGAGVMAVANFFEPFMSRVAEASKGLGAAISGAFKSGEFQTGLDILNTGFLGAVVILITKFITKIKGMMGGADLGGGIMDSIKGIFSELGGTLQAFQGQIKSKTLMNIALAVGILTLSVVALSMIDSGKLFVALAAISIMFVQLGAAMAAFDAMFTMKSAAKLTILSAGMIGLATAMLIFSGAIAIMGAMSWEGLAKGLVGLAGALTIMGLAMLLLSKTGPGAILGSVALVIASAGIVLLAGALQLLALLSWDDIGRAMVTLGGTLAILAIGLYLMSGALPGAAALVVAAAGILVIAGALLIFAQLSWDDIGRAMVTLGGTLAILAIGLTLMIAALPGAAALVVASGGLAVLAGVLLLFAMLDWASIGIIMVALGGTLLILAVGLNAMTGAIPGALALIIAAGALSILAPVLLLLSTLSWAELGMGLAALALALTVIGVAGYLLIPALPGLIGLGVAVMLLGVGVLAAGIGVLALATGLTALSLAGGAAISVLVIAVTSIGQLIPFILQQVGLGLIEIIKIIGTNGPAILVAITTVLMALIQAIITIIPEAVNAIVLLVTMLVNALVRLVPMLVNAAAKLIMGILEGLARNIPKIIDKGTDVIIAFIQGISDSIPKLLTAGADLVIKFVNGIAETIRTKSSELKTAGGNVASAIVEGMTGGITGGASKVVTAAKNMASSALSAAKDFLGIKSPSREFKKIGRFSTEGLANGLIEFSSISENAATKMGSNTLQAIKKSMADAGSAMSLSMDTTPTIRPVMDLSGFKKDASQISGILGGQTLAVDGISARANAIADKYGEYQQVRTEESSRTTTEVNMTQNNYSPKSLPATEIYRNSKNQMSILKGELEKKDA